MKYRILHITILFVSICSSLAFGQSIDQLDRQAQDYFDDKNYNQAVTLWLTALELDPQNERIQQKIEMVYELKQRKDISYQRARLNYFRAMKTLENDLDRGRDATRNALSNFVTAYRIDPSDPNMQEMRQQMEELQALLRAEEEKDRLSRALKARYERLRNAAEQFMKEEKYREALENWKEILSFFPKDQVALEGKRTATLAIENRLRFEKIRAYMAKGKELYEQKKFPEARVEFVQVTQLDDRNREARKYLRDIEEKLDEQRLYEQRRQQAENFYVAGMAGLRQNNFDEARDSFENALAMVEDYRDAQQQLDRIPALEKAYFERQKELKLRKINETFQSGLIAFTSGNYKEAIANFDATLNLDPENKLADEYLERAKNAQRQLEEERVDENSPYYDIVQSLILAGTDLYERGEYTKSREKWTRILSLFPKNRMASEYLLRCDLKMNPERRGSVLKEIYSDGVSLFDDKKYDDARNKFQLVQSIDPEYPGLNGYITRLDAMGRGGGAVREARVPRAVIEQRYRQAMNTYQQGGEANARQAITLLRQVVQDDPGYTRAVIALNKLESQFRVGGAVAQQQGPQLTAAQRQLIKQHYYRGISYYSNNNFTKAIEEWRKVLAIDPTDRKARNNIRKTLALMGQ